MRDPLGPPSAPASFPDPFWAAVHRRHPDVDLVVLPPERDVERVVDPIEPLDPDAVRDRVAATAAARWSAAVPESEVVPATRWRFGPVEGSVRAEARAVERRRDGFPALVTLRGELETEGWQVRRPDGPVERLLATTQELELAASYAEESGTLLLVVTSTPVTLEARQARELVRGGR